MIIKKSITVSNFEITEIKGRHFSGSETKGGNHFSGNLPAYNNENPIKVSSSAGYL